MVISEASKGLGLAIGPIFVEVLDKVDGLSWPYFTFTVLLLVFAYLTPKAISLEDSETPYMTE